MLTLSLALLALLVGSGESITRSHSVRNEKISPFHHGNHHLVHSRQPGLNTAPPEFPEIETLTPLKRRQERTTYNSSTICDASLATSSFEDFQCFNQFDCVNWLRYHGQLSLFTTPNVHSEAMSSGNWNLVDCVKHKCVLNEPKKTGDVCTYSKDSCSYPNSCSSGVCQPPIPAGCGNCAEDASSCLIGTVCSSTSNNCVEWLNEGDKCIYNVRDVYTTGDETYEGWFPLIYPCGISQTTFGKVMVPGLTCDFQSQKCIRDTTAIAKKGDSCSFSIPCEAGLTCADTPTGQMCVTLPGENEACDLQCADGLLCDSDDRVCKRYASVKEGQSCGKGTNNGELCQVGLICLDGTCARARAIGETCNNENRCAYGHVCNGGVCTEAYSVKEGGECDVYYDSMGPCEVGLDCIEGTCRKSENPTCEQSGLCMTSSYRFGSCQCDDATKDSTCQPLKETEADTLKSLTKCLGKSTYSLFEIDYFYTNPKFFAFACCAICDDTDGNLLKSIWYSQYFDRLAYGFNGVQLSCEDPQNPALVNRTKDWCNYVPDYSQAGMQSLVKCPGAKPYQGLPNTGRLVIDKTDKLDPVSCGQLHCNGNGQCSGSNNTVCKCDAGFTGETCNLNLADREKEKEALLDFFVSTNGIDWVTIQGWSNPKNDHCKFKGIRCNSYGFVESITLQFNNLRGQLPESIGKLQQLRRLDLSGNYLGGQLPEALYTLPNLVELDLSRNFLTGQVSSDIQQLKNLTKLALHNNRLQGNLPYSIGQLKELDILLLHRNNFTGSIPLSLATLTDVTTIDLTNNNLDASSNLPANLCSHCERYINQCNLYGCSKCKDGQLLSCHNPNKILSRRALDFSSYADVYEYNSNLFPEECGYHFG